MIGIFYFGYLIKSHISVLLVDLDSIVTQLAVEVLTILNVYVQIYLNFVYLCAILFLGLNSYITLGSGRG